MVITIAIQPSACHLQLFGAQQPEVFCDPCLSSSVYWLSCMNTRCRLPFFALLAVMGMFAWLTGSLYGDKAPACSTESLHMFSNFVDFFIDSSFVGLPAASNFHSPPAGAQAFASHHAATAPSGPIQRLKQFATAAAEPSRMSNASKDSQLPTAVPAADRLIAIGDLHGDFPKAKRAFKLAGLIGDDDRWTGGTTVCVQVICKGPLVAVAGMGRTHTPVLLGSAN